MSAVPAIETFEDQTEAIMTNNDFIQVMKDAGFDRNQAGTEFYRPFTESFGTQLAYVNDDMESQERILMTLRPTPVPLRDKPDAA